MSRSSVLSQDAYEHILELILSKKLVPGDKIPETKIAEDLKISRTPVRDAVQRLSLEGLVDISANRFAKITEYSPVQIREIGMMRLNLDKLSTELALICGNQMDFLNLKALAQKSMDAFEVGDEAVRREADCDFHLELAKISNNSLLFKFQNEMYLRVQFLLLHYNNATHTNVNHIRQHVELADALINRNHDLALAIIKDHLIKYYNLDTYYPAEFINNF